MIQSTQPAVLGGKPARGKPFPAHPVIGDAEKRAVMAVLDSGHLSGFVAAPGDAFLGGERVRAFERRFAAYHEVEFAIAFNSATSALHAAVIAVGVRPGDQVIVSPYTFTASASCVLMHQGVPVFADVDAGMFCMDPASIEQLVTPRTKAIIPVHLFGQPADMDTIMAGARRNGLKVIEDCAQAVGAMYRGRRTGTMGDCGVFSFTENKTMATGEGGMLITDDPAIAEAARLVRNHGEVVWNQSRPSMHTESILGWNYRMTEMEAALGMVQLDKLDAMNATRIELCNHLTQRLSGIEGLTPQAVPVDCRHVYYVFGWRFDAHRFGLSRSRFVEAVSAEGIPIAGGYVRPLYLGPIYHEKMPDFLTRDRGDISYDAGLCPIAERLYEKELVLTAVARPPATTGDMSDVVTAIQKVYEHRASLRSSEQLVGAPC